MRTDSKKIKFIAVIACVVLVLAASIGATVAYIIDQQTVTLTYNTPKFDMQFIENNDIVFYKSNVPVYFRFMISYSGDINDITVESDSNMWQSEGVYYYYKGVLPATADGNTFKLPSITISTESSVQYDIVAEICQIEPALAVQDSWGVSYDNGLWTSSTPTNP